LSATVDLVVKVGGNLGRERGVLQKIEPLRALHREHCVLVVPGGGLFADMVRVEAARHAITESAGHWMGILAMEQYAHLLAGLLDEATLAHGPEEISVALAGERLPVLAPYRWLRAEDPLPHSWDVTSDSIAAWVAGRVGASRLILVKRSEEEIGVDAYFEQVVSPGLEWEVVVPEKRGWRTARRGPT
jgi:aspartokinase-like uncharacterized kinase